MATPKELEELFQMLPSSIAPRILDKKALEKDLERANNYLLALKAKNPIDWKTELRQLISMIKEILHRYVVSCGDPLEESIEILLNITSILEKTELKLNSGGLQS